MKNKYARQKSQQQQHTMMMGKHSHQSRENVHQNLSVAATGAKIAKGIDGEFLSEAHGANAFELNNMGFQVNALR